MQRERETIAFSKKRIWREAPFSAYGEREKKENESVKKERKKERKEKETQ